MILRRFGVCSVFLVLLFTHCSSQEKINWFRADGSINWEAEKEQKKMATDTIVIHHTGDPPGMTWQRLSEIQYERLYVPRFQSDDPDPLVKGVKVQSGHFREVEGKKVEIFYGYHWLIREDGTTERLLNDNEVGWHSGNWTVNNRSIGLCFDGDFRSGSPSEKALASCARLIGEYQKKFTITQVIGHSEVKATECPGN